VTYIMMYSKGYCVVGEVYVVTSVDYKVVQESECNKPLP